LPTPASRRLGPGHFSGWRGDRIEDFDAKNNPSDPGIHSGNVQPGQSATVTINLRPGDWYFYCNFRSHEQAGMLGTLTAQ
jgi:uncharacterized cupredoxin-like copper-binding protein